ncbi:uncharacterized protein LOC123548240 [Mercenaria mercenaria]|uniref:uncharacterized protein LOC123548240 n=1 Tax=Mercenaria mercenaria TaxID=6596 RepID=UPI00234F5E95|nr:uncharacterized protein LOC123548240 [Mercenaria mercenaria]
MDEANCLVSPCKKLKLEPVKDDNTAELKREADKLESSIDKHEKDDFIHAKDTSIQGYNTCTPEKSVGEVIDVYDNLQTERVSEEVDMMEKEVTNFTTDQHHLQHNTQKYIDNATAILLKGNNKPNSAEEFEALISLCEQNDGSENLTVPVASNNEPLNDSPDVHKFQIPILGEPDTSEDFQETLDVVNACTQEIKTLIENRKTEVEVICSSVDVSAIIKQMETVYQKTKVSDSEGVFEELPKSGSGTDLDASMTSESTDDLNSSVKTITDVSVQNENCEKIDGQEQDANDLNNDNEESLDDTIHVNCESQEGHYEHVYANVVIKCSEKGHAESNRENRLKDLALSEATDIKDRWINVSDEEKAKNDISQHNMEHNSILERTIGEGKECDENASNYFCVVEANNFEGTYNGDKDEDKTEHFESDLTLLEPVHSEMVSLTMSRLHTIAQPLCASTPVPPNNTDMSEMFENEHKKLYPTFAITKQPVVTNQAKTQGNSEPLCTSTPVVKSVQGLRMRDMNIMRDTDEKKHVKFAQKIDTKMVAVNLKEDVANENDMQDYENYTVAKNNEKNSKKESQVVRGTFKRDRESKREKKKMKGVRVEKFKEYMGPGLTSGITSENTSEAVDSSNKNLVKNSDIETCTLTEYKGFGLTGPLPDKPLQTSTPLPPKVVDSNKVVHFDPNCKNDGSATSLKRCISGVSLGGRPAGTEGLLSDQLTSDKVETLAHGNNMQPCIGTGQKLRQTVSESKFGQKANSCLADLNTRTLTRHTSDLGPHGYNKQNRLTGWLASVQAHKTPLAALSEHGEPAATATLRPDEAYPSVTAVKGDNSESNSNADKSDKSEKMMVDPKVLQNSGQLKVSAYMNFGLLTVHVIQGRQLSTKWKNSCDSFVKLSLLPDDGKKPKCKTEVVQDTNNPLYDEKFSFELNEEDHNKRLMVSVWHRDTLAGVNEFLGCMSFGIRHLTNPKKEVNGWYYLLTEDVGRKKHLQVSHRQYPQLKIRNQSHIPSVNKDVWGTESLSLTLHRGKTGFGFSVIEACPVRVGRVDGASPAEAAGLQPGDIIIRLNKQNVSRSTATSVAKLIKHSSNTMVLELHRPRPVTYEHLENSPLSSTNTDTCNYGNDITHNNYRDQSVPQIYTLNDDEDKENEVSIEDQTLYPINPHIASLATSTPLPLLARGHRTVQTCEVRKQEAIHRLLSLELDFIDLMHAGMQRYSRPLRHCILSHSHHAALFQNIEKLVTISEYHVKQMHDNAPSSFISEDDTDTSGSSDNHNFIQSIGLIYQSKVHMLCQAYDLYAKGISAANQLLSELRRNEDFVRFVRDPPLEGNQPSISTFIYRPVQHVRELYKVIQEVFSNTSTDSSDYNSLKELVEVLQECSTNITNYSCERVESLTSLTSRDSKVSFTASMKSRSSSTSCSSASSKGQGHLLQTSKGVDHEVMKIQDRLVFPSNVPVFQLCQDDRHLIFSGEMFKREGQQWMKIHVYLFTDLILQTVKESDGYLKVIQEPTMLRDIAAMDSQRQHSTDFVLYCNPRLQDSRHSGKRKLNFRAPSTEQKMAWKSLVEQRVFAVRGTMDYYSSTSDVSSSSASAIVI